MHQILINDLRQKAEQGEAQAQFDLAHCYYRGDGVPQDYVEAVRWGRKAADQGHARAQCMIGVCYKAGCGVPRDYTEAVRWLQKSAFQGYDRAQNGLGLCYYKGEGVPKNHNEAAVWFNLAATQGNTEAQWHLGNCYTHIDGDFEKATKLFCLVAEKGDPEYQHLTGFWYASGFRIPKDYDQAIKWYRLAAMQGHKDSQYNLAILYGFESESGCQVVQDKVESYAWFSIYISAVEILGKSEFIELQEMMTADEIKAGQELAEQYTLKIRHCADDASKRQQS